MSVAVLDMYPDSTSRSFVLAGFYIGYASSQVIFSWLAGLWGPKFTLQVAVFLWAFAGLSTIWLVEYKIAVFITRVIIGLAEGANYPCQQTFFSWWIPNQERSGSWGGICSGEAFGTIVALLTCPYLSHEFGWRSIFWFSTGISILWLIFFSIFVTSKPEHNISISEEELDFIERNRMPLENFQNVPFGAILTHPPFYATIFTHCCYNWGFYVGISFLPDYFDSVFHLDYKKSGFVTILPYVALFIISYSSGFLADYLINDKQYSVSLIRRAFNTIGLIGPGACFFILGHLNEDDLTLAALFLTIGISLGGFAISGGYWNNFSDLSPRFSPYFLAISNSIASIPGIVGIWATGRILDGHTDNWALVFSLASGIEFAGAICFVLFASTKPLFPHNLTLSYESVHDEPAEVINRSLR